MFAPISRSGRARLGFVVTLALCALGAPAYAAPPSDGPPPGGGGGRHKPPPFAYEACEGLAADATCSVELPDGSSLSGTCTADENDALFCRPERMPPPPSDR
jgi:hypothetical protein